MQSRETLYGEINAGILRLRQGLGLIADNPEEADMVQREAAKALRETDRIAVVLSKLLGSPAEEEE
jgi:hypothetical protein